MLLPSGPGLLSMASSHIRRSNDTTLLWRVVNVDVKTALDDLMGLTSAGSLQLECTILKLLLTGDTLAQRHAERAVFPTLVDGTSGTPTQQIHATEHWYDYNAERSEVPQHIYCALASRRMIHEDDTETENPEVVDGLLLCAVDEKDGMYSRCGWIHATTEPECGEFVELLMESY